MIWFRKLLRTESLHWNFLGNVAGRLCNGVLSIAVVPVYVHLLGAEAYGIVSFVLTFQAMLALLDFGLAGTVRREVATLRRPGEASAAADTVRTFEYLYWCVALVIAGGFALLAGWLSRSWVTIHTLSPADVRLAILLGGLAFAVRWPVALYTGVLQGRERQVLQNALMVSVALARVGAALAALLLVERTVQAFLIAQTIVNVAEVLLFRQAALALTQGEVRGRFSKAVVQRVWRYAVGYNLVGTFGMLVSGADKLLISKLLPLTQLTYYSMASTATGALQFIYLALQVSLFPRLASAWHRGDLDEVRRSYLFGLRLSIYLCTAPALILAFFPHEVLLLWTQSPELSAEVARVLPLLAIASLANCAVAMPLNTLLAVGETRIPFLVNLVSLPLMVAGCFWGVSRLGILGAAICWLAVNLLSFAVYGWRCVERFWERGQRPILWGLPVMAIVPGVLIGFLSGQSRPQGLGIVAIAGWLIATAVLIYLSGVPAFDREERQMLCRPFVAGGRRLLGLSGRGA